MRTRVKICGITRQEDALAAVEQGADALGLVFYNDSPRFVSATDAQVVVAQLPPFICKVGLFVDAPAVMVEETLRGVQLDLLQFHGNETPEYCRQFGIPYIKALRMRENSNVVAYAQEYAEARGILLDTYQAGVAGGTGEVFDWSMIPREAPSPLILAGGLTPDNVASAIEQVRPYAVDVSGGVEASKGIKDADKIAAFMKEVKRVSI